MIANYKLLCYQPKSENIVNEKILGNIEETTLSQILIHKLGDGLVGFSCMVKNFHGLINVYRKFLDPTIFLPSISGSNSFISCFISLLHCSFFSAENHFSDFRLSLSTLWFQLKHFITSSFTIDYTRLLSYINSFLKSACFTLTTIVWIPGGLRIKMSWLIQS